MKITKAIFKNWVGFQIGLGRDTLELDLSGAKHRLCLILAPNRSGKTTLLEGLTLFSDIYSNVRDSGDFIIPDKEGYRELWVTHHDMRWISKVYWLKDKTRCFLTKHYPDGREEDLNPSGNVRSYEEQLYLQFGLLKDHNRLLFLGPGMKDIVSMTPSDRKLNISKFTPNIEIYLQLYKLTGKYYAALRNELQAITTELNKIGNDRKLLEAAVTTAKKLHDEALEKVRHLTNIHERSSKTLASFTVGDRPIIEVYEKEEQYYTNIYHRAKQQNEAFKRLCALYNLSSNEPQETYAEYLQTSRDTSAKLQFSYNAYQQRREELLRSKESTIAMLHTVQTLHAQYIQDNDPSRFITESAVISRELAKLQEDYLHLSKTMPDSVTWEQYQFTKDDASSYLVFIDGLMERLERLKEHYSSHAIIERYTHNTLNIESEEENYDVVHAQLRNITESLSNLQAQRLMYEQVKETGDTIPSISKDCKDLSCPARKQFENYTRLMEEHPSVEKMYHEMLGTKETLQRQLEELSDFLTKVRDFLEDIQKLSGFIDTHSKLIGKFPVHDTFKNLASLFTNPFLLPHARSFSEFSYLKEREATLVTRLSEIQELIARKDAYTASCATQEKEINALHNELDRVSEAIAALDSEYGELNLSMKTAQREVQEVTKLVAIRKELVQTLKNCVESHETLKVLNNRYHLSTIYTKALADVRRQLSTLEENLTISEETLSNARYTLTRYDEFVEKRAKLSKDFELLEILRKTWSSTTGIPLIFIEEFMNTLLEDANNYLLEIWTTDELLIDGFTIDEKNFFINVKRGSEDEATVDVSRCSGAERATICSVLSLALLKQAPKVRELYTITKFDEVDAYLDHDTKDRFTYIMNELLDDIGCEQAFICSHHDTFQSDTDVILLKNSEEYEARMLTGSYNIIFKL
jgi:hypothetical protein